MIKITCISDTHRFHNEIKIPQCDFLIHAGDIGWDNSSYYYSSNFFKWFSEQPAKHKLFICGNHDIHAERFPTLIKEEAQKHNIIYMHHNFVEIDGLKFYGSNYSPRFGRWAWMKDHGLPMYLEWEKIPEETDVLITHSPPWGILDEIPYSAENVGCEELRDKLKYLSKLKAVVSGHLHYSHGVRQIQNKLFVNAAICTEDYQPLNSPITFYL